MVYIFLWSSLEDYPECPFLLAGHFKSLQIWSRLKVIGHRGDLCDSLVHHFSHLSDLSPQNVIFFVMCINTGEFNRLSLFCLFLQNPALQTSWPFSSRNYFSGIYKSVNVTRRSDDAWHTSCWSKGDVEGITLNQTLTWGQKSFSCGIGCRCTGRCGTACMEWALHIMRAKPDQGQSLKNLTELFSHYLTWNCELKTHTYTWMLRK